MKFEWTYQGEQMMRLLTFIRHQGVPRQFITIVKHHGGQILVNGQEQTVRYPLYPGDVVTLIAPDEPGNDRIIGNDRPLDILYEDRDLIILNKPAGVASIPSFQTPDDSIAHRLKGYYERHAYPDQVIHIVTRLDRDTTGIMVVAKHRLAHAMLDRQLQEKQLHKYYYALTSKRHWAETGWIDKPIQRAADSFILREVGPDGQTALTEYRCLAQFDRGALLALQLHTGRTHQIRVHLASEGGPLIADTLYGAPPDRVLDRQALHCYQVTLTHPFTQERIIFNQSMPEDMKRWCAH